MSGPGVLAAEQLRVWRGRRNLGGFAARVLATAHAAAGVAPTRVVGPVECATPARLAGPVCDAYEDDECCVGVGWSPERSIVVAFDRRPSSRTLAERLVHDIGVVVYARTLRVCASQAYGDGDWWQGGCECRSTT